MSRRLTTEEFVEKAKAVHDDRYDYSQVKYVNTKTKVTIICSEHGPFPQTPNKHLSGRGCPDCAPNKKLTHEVFIKRARAKYGDYYDYSRVEYVNVDTNVIIGCPVHGFFNQTPFTHLNSKFGCRACGLAAAGLQRRLTKDEFIEKAKAVHGDRYDYSLVEYVNNSTEVTIICREHDSFPQTPAGHLGGKGCPECGGTKPLTTETFIEKARAVHDDRYDYSLVEYVNAKTNVTIICPDHGPFPQTPSKHLAGRGCEECGGSKKLTTEIFIERANAIHDDRYDYSLVDYVDNKINVTIICPDHGSFPQKPSHHLSDVGCPACAGNQPLTTETFIEKAEAIHGKRYDYSQVKYVNAYTNVTIICPDHGPFPQTPDSHANSNSGCPDCIESGFSPSQPGTLYYLAITTYDGDTRYKIGITNRTVEERFLGADLARIRIVKTWRYAVGRAAAEREAEILRKYEGDRYYGPDVLRSGNSELFTHDILGLDERDDAAG